VKGNLEQTIKL